MAMVIKQDKKNKNLTVEDKPSTVSHFMAFNPDNDVLKQRTQQNHFVLLSFLNLHLQSFGTQDCSLRDGYG
jgi:hypothetical protein